MKKQTQEFENSLNRGISSRFSLGLAGLGETTVGTHPAPDLVQCQLLGLPPNHSPLSHRSSTASSLARARRSL